MLDKIGLSDKIRDLNNQLKFMEEKNAHLELRVSKKTLSGNALRPIFFNLLSDAEASPKHSPVTEKPCIQEVKHENIAEKSAEIKTQRKFSTPESEQDFKENAATEARLEQIADNFNRDCKQQ